MTANKYLLYTVFINLCECRSYSKTARELGYASHKIISQKMLSLAKLLGAKSLFTRTKRGVTPSKAAMDLYYQIKPALDAIGAAEENFLKTHNLPYTPRPQQPMKLCPTCADIVATLIRN